MSTRRTAWGQSLAWAWAAALSAQAQVPGGVRPALSLHLEHEQGGAPDGGQHPAERLDMAILGARLQGESWQLGLQWPWLRRVDADGRAQGLGDGVVRATVSPWPVQEEGWGLDLSAKRKLATGRAELGLGTGACDTVWELDLLNRHRNGRLAWVTVGHRRTGQASGAVRATPNPWHLELGWQARLGPAVDWGLVAYARQAVGPSGSSRDLTAYFQHRQDAHLWRWSAMLGNGRGSAKAALGLTWRYAWD